MLPVTKTVFLKTGTRQHALFALWEPWGTLSWEIRVLSRSLAMHLGNEAITPECAALAFGAAAGGLGLAAVAARRELTSGRKAALAGGLGALVFAAQAVNAPILPGSSAHLVGGVLLAWAVGPGLGAWVMTGVLLIQALVLGDGGIMALGANVLNMALLPAGLVAIARRAEVEATRWGAMRPALLAGFSVPIAALLIVGQTALF